MKRIRSEIKKYIKKVDEKTLKRAHNLLEADVVIKGWNVIPDEVRGEVELSIRQADNGEAFTHEEVWKKYPQWFSKQPGQKSS